MRRKNKEGIAIKKLKKRQQEKKLIRYYNILAHKENNLVSKCYYEYRFHRIVT